MQHTIAAVFSNPMEARQACDALVSAGFSRDEMHLSQNDETSQLDEGAQARDSEAPGAAIRSFFTEVFGPARSTDVELYSEAVRKGNCVLTVNVPEDDLLDQVTDVLDQYHPIDIDEQASQWKSGGWAEPGSMRQADSDALPAQQSRLAETPAASAQRSGVRVFRHEEEQSAQSDLNQNGNIPTDQTASSSSDTSRSPQVDLENLPGSPDLFGAAAEADQERDDAYYKDHWDKNYADSGGEYEDYAPAYKHGALLAGSNRQKGRAWEDAEPDVKSDWEEKNPDSTWEKIKAAVRHGWESMTNRVNS